MFALLNQHVTFQALCFLKIVISTLPCPAMKASTKKVAYVNTVVNAESTGIVFEELDEFTKQNKGTDRKLCIDGKKLAIGFGKRQAKWALAHNEESPTFEE